MSTNIEILSISALFIYFLYLGLQVLTDLFFAFLVPTIKIEAAAATKAD